MSREIKFRIWDDFKKEWLGKSDKDSLTFYGFHLVGEVITVQCPPQWALDECCVVEQYTGLKDKNGKEIYEGDIVTETIDDGDNKIIQIYEVYWDEDMLNFGIRGTKGFNYNLHDELWETNASREVIGNIHENPELLEDENGKN